MGERSGRDLMLIEDKTLGGLSRWVPLLVVTSVVSGFATLAWYAYHTGMQSMRDEDLVVVEADKSPIKEKPLDPGGMQFPNQDKTIFDTFSVKGRQQPKVERVLPMPEEPLPKNADTDTTSWINDAHKDAKPSEPLPKPEELFGKAPQKAAAPAHDTPAPVHQVIEANAAPQPDESETYVAPKSDHPEEAKVEPKPEPKVEATPAPAPALEKKEAFNPPPAVPEKKELPKPADVVDHATASAGAYRIQLGAYRSEKEAKDNWRKIQKKQPALAGKEPQIVKADLGSKGIYYRLRVAGLASTADAKALCATLTAGGQQCILPVGE